MTELNVVQTQEGNFVLNDEAEVISESIKFEVYGTGTKSEMTRAAWAKASALSPDDLQLKKVECTEIGESYAIVYARYK